MRRRRGSAPFEDGWVWYIPIRKYINGRRRSLHSMGLVTEPSILKKQGRDFLDPAVFLDRMKQVPLLKDLIQNAERVDDKMLTITNYSMLNEQFCNYDERWILLGDSAFFVDPLFSSGVAFATGMALSVSLMAKSTLEGDLSDQAKRDIWYDYDARWHITAETFGLAIDQWYHAIAKFNPNSVYWNSRGIQTRADLNVREATFHAMVNTGITPDLLRILTRGSLDPNSLDADGPFLKAHGVVLEQEPDDSTLLTLAQDVTVREALSLDVPGFKAAIVPATTPEPVKALIREYWSNPVANGDKMPGALDTPLKCHRIYFRNREHGPQFRIINERDGGLDLYAMLQEGPVAYGKLKLQITQFQSILLNKLLNAKMVTPYAQSATAS